MNKTMLSIALAAAASAGFAQTPTFTQVARYNLGTFGNATTTSVAFDGTNAYVGTSNSAAGITGESVYKIANALTNSGQTPTTFATQSSARGDSRATDLVYANNSLYWGYGLGDSSTPAGWGVAKYNLDGTLSTGFGSGGVVSQLSAFTAGTGTTATRLDAIDFDPITGKLAGISYGGGYVFETDPNTGVATTQLTFPVAPSTYTWRDMSFDGSGNLYARTNGGADVKSWTRSGTTLVNQNSLTSLGTGSALSRVKAVSGSGFGTFALANSAASSTAPGVTVLSSTGSVLTTLTGTENGLGTAFGNSLGAAKGFGFNSAVVNGSTYVFVTGISDAGGANTLAIYQVQAVPEPASLAALGFGALAMLRRRRA